MKSRFGIAGIAMVSGFLTHTEFALAQKAVGISKVPYTIHNPGSYTLKGNTTGITGSDGIVIAADNVTLDLGGFVLLGVPGSGAGIRVPDLQRNITIRNGTVRNWGDVGVDALNAANSEFESLRVSDNTDDGLHTGIGSHVRSCVAASNGGDGIQASDGSSISGCTATSNGGTGFIANAGSSLHGCTAIANTNGINASTGSTIVGCTARANTVDGITVDQGTISDCSAQANGNRGILATDGSSVLNSTARVNSGDGILITTSCQVRGCNADLNGYSTGDGAGIHATGSRNRIDGNNVTENDRGVDVDSTNNLIIRNSASGNTTNFDIVASNTVGPTVDSSTIAASTNPHANYTH